MANWHELIIEGEAKSIRAFVAGFEAGRGGTVHAVFGSDVELEPQSIGARLKELFGAGSHHVLFVPASQATSLVAALGATGANVGLRLERQREIESAAFEVHVVVYSRGLARDVRGAFVESLPAGARIEGLSESEESHPEAVGPEPFAPLHEYIYRVSGRIVGEFQPVLHVWRGAREREFSEIGSLTLTEKTLR